MPVPPTHPPAHAALSTTAGATPEEEVQTDFTMYPDEPNMLSPGGLHLLHHDIVDRMGEVVVRATRLIDVQEPVETDNMAGSPRCRCLDAAAIRSRFSSFFWPGREEECLLYSSPVRHQTHDAYCYPADYGSSCATRDPLLPPFCATRGSSFGVQVLPEINSSHWCYDAWCYVDENDCDLRTADGNVMVSPSSFFAGLYYS